MKSLLSCILVVGVIAFTPAQFKDAIIDAFVCCLFIESLRQKAC